MYDTPRRLVLGGPTLASSALLVLATMAGACQGASSTNSPTESQSATETADEYTEAITGPVVIAKSRVLQGDELGPDILTTKALPSGAGPTALELQISKDAGPRPVPDATPSFDSGPVPEAGIPDVFPGDDAKPPFDGGGTLFGPSGFWRFDDCSPNSRVLVDSTGNGLHAKRALGRPCAPGISDLAVQVHLVKDAAEIANAPQLSPRQRLAVAAWVNPTETAGHHPIVLKRLNAKTAFSLGIHDGNVEFSVVLTSGTTVLSRAPIAKNAWTHVAGLYDGRFLFLFVNGEQVGQVLQVGTIRDVASPVRVGATTQTQHFDGLIDDVWLSTNEVFPGELQALSCIRRPATVSVSPATSGPVAPGTLVHYDITITNQNRGACFPADYFLTLNPFGAGAGGTSDAGPFPSAAARSDASVGVTEVRVTEVGVTEVGVIDVGVVTDSVASEGGGSFDTGVGNPNSGISAFENPPFAFGVLTGASATLGADIVGSDDAAPGPHLIPFSVQDFSDFTGATATGVLQFELAAQTGCRVSTSRELMIKDPSVVDDRIRTTFDAAVDDPRRGAWSFARLARDMAPSPAEAPAMVEKVFRSWLTDQTVNGFRVAARPSMQQVVLDGWPRTADGALDLERAPLRLLAIVNRIDVRDLDQGHAGEGRFVFGVLGRDGFPLQFTIIMEYHLPASTEADVLGWASAWHDLATHPFPSEEYNAALLALTARFSARGTSPGQVNGNSLAQLRTNEIALEGRWEMREFTLSPTTKMLEPSVVKLTPDLGFNGTSTVAQFVNDNEAAIIAERHTVPDIFNGAPFGGGAIFNDLIAWQAPGIANNEARHHFSLNTCNGCHSTAETNTTFLMVFPRSGGQESSLSPFMTGTTVFDPFTGQQRSFNDLGRRNADLRGLVCPAAAPTPSTAARTAADASAPAPTTSIRKGIGRVH